MDEQLIQALNDCLARIEAGATPEEALAEWADLGHALAPLVEAAVALRQAEFRAAAPNPAVRAALERRAARLYPPSDGATTGPGSPASRFPGGRLVVALLIGLALVTLLGFLIHQRQSTSAKTKERHRAGWGSDVTARPKVGSPVARATVVSRRRPSGPRAIAGAIALPLTAIPIMPPRPPSTAAKAVAVETATAGSESAAVPLPGMAPSTPTPIPFSAGEARAETPPRRPSATPSPMAAAFAGRVTGRVIDRDTRQGIPLAMVEVFAADGPRRIAQRTEGDGSYAVDLEPGRYRLRATAAGYRAQWYDRVPEPESATEVTVLDARSLPVINFDLEHETPGASATPAEFSEPTVTPAATPDVLPEERSP